MNKKQQFIFVWVQEEMNTREPSVTDSRLNNGMEA